MKLHIFKLGAGCMTLYVAVALPSHAQVDLIGPDTRNGSFENGASGPWNGYLELIEDPGFATEGNWYARIGWTLQPVPTIQNLTPNPDAGLAFALSFDARMGSPGYNQVSVGMSARTPTGTPLSASLTSISAPPLTGTTWQSFQFALQMPAAWNSSGITFSINFNKDQPLNDITHYSYLDNVVLQQVPEPSSLLLLSLGGLALAAARARTKARN